MGQILILCNFIGFHCILYCFFHVLPEGEVYCYLWESFHQRVTEDKDIASGRLMNDNAIQSSMELSNKYFGNCVLERPKH